MSCRAVTTLSTAVQRDEDAYLMPETCVASLRADVYLDGGAWDGADAQDLQCGPGGGLLAVLDGASLARRDFRPRSAAVPGGLPGRPSACRG